MTVWCAAVGTLSPVSSPSAPGEVCPGALKLGGALESSDVAGAGRQDGGSYRWTSSMQSSSTLPPGGVSWWSLPASECSKLPPEGWSLPSLGAVGAGGATGGSCRGVAPPVTATQVRSSLVRWWLSCSGRSFGGGE